MDPFYTTAKWKRLRAAVMRRDQYLCQISKRYGKKKPAEMVHHIFPRQEFPEFELRAWNLISLTLEKHDELHDRTSGALTEAGIDLLRRTARKNGIEIPDRYK